MALWLSRKVHSSLFSQHQLVSAALFFVIVLALGSMVPESYAMATSLTQKQAQQGRQRVMVTGANGFIASHIVKQLLGKGCYEVHACVRDASRLESVEHLLELPNADELLTLFSTGDYAKQEGNGGKNRFEEAMKGCDAVFHTATPLNVKFGSSFDGERDIYQPAMQSTKELLDCISKNSLSSTVQCLVLTSSMSAIAPRPEPPIKDESHWSDENIQRESGNWYGCTKTSQEKLVQQFIEEHNKNREIQNSIKYAAICPTMVLGPNLRELCYFRKHENSIIEPSGTMGKFASWLQGSKPQAPNDSMSFVHVEDCAAMHVAAFESSSASGRYMCLYESLHWNDIAVLIKHLYPQMKQDILPYDGPDTIIQPTQFDFTKVQKSFQKIKIRSTEEIFSDSIRHLQYIQVLPV